MNADIEGEGRNSWRFVPWPNCAICGKNRVLLNLKTREAIANVRDAIPIVGGRGARSKPRIPRPPPERVRVRRPQPRALAPLAPQPHTPFAPLVFARASARAELLRASFLPFSGKFHPEFPYRLDSPPQNCNWTKGQSNSWEKHSPMGLKTKHLDRIPYDARDAV